MSKSPLVFLIAFLACLWSAAPIPAQGAALRICADPDYVPYSNRAGQGFENKIAEAVSKALGEPLEYTWESTRSRGGFPEFLARTLDANKCDAVMNIPYGSREELTTQPYYVSSYVFVFARRLLNQATTAQILKRIKIGFENDTPVEDGLKIRGLIPATIAFDVGSNSTESPEVMLNALDSGQIDVLITWQPAIGAFLRRHPGLEVVPVPNARTLGPPEQYTFPMSMGVRQGNESLKRRLDDVIAKHQSELTSILAQHGVRLYTPQ